MLASRARLSASVALATPLATAALIAIVLSSSTPVLCAQTTSRDARASSHSLVSDVLSLSHCAAALCSLMLPPQVSDSHGVLAAWADAPESADSASREQEALWFAIHSLSLRIDGAAGHGFSERPFVRRLLSSSSRILSVRSWQPAGGSRMMLSCIMHDITVELSDGKVHVFQVQRKSHGLLLTSHTLRAPRHAAHSRTRPRDNVHGGGKGTRIMSYNIWNYNGNWLARARMIGDVIEASGAGDGMCWRCC
jgi:hypothetical protein